MEEFDPVEYKLLVHNPRISLRELAKNLDVSTPVVFHRLQEKMRSGSLLTFTTISTNYLNATMVTVFGTVDKERPFERIIDDLRDDGCVCYVAFCSPNMVIVTGILRQISDMEPFSKSVSSICQMSNPTLAIESLGRVGDNVPFQTVPADAILNDLDLRIISSLHHDCRKTCVKVAGQVGSSTKTVQKHIKKMVEKGLIEMWVLGDPAILRYVTTAIHVYVQEGVDVLSLAKELARRYPDEVYAFRRYLNLPNLISLASCHTTTSGLNRLVDELERDERIDKVMPNVVVRGVLFDTWRDEMLPKLVPPTSSGSV